MVAVPNGAYLSIYIKFHRITPKFEEILHVMVCCHCRHILYPIQTACNNTCQKHNIFSCAAFLLTVFSILDFILQRVNTQDEFYLTTISVGFF